MANDIFRREVAEIFEKLAWPYNPAEVAAEAAARGHPSVARSIRRGQHVVSAGTAAARAIGAAAHGAGHVGSWLLRPAHSEGAALARELGRAGSWFTTTPRRALIGGGALVSAPILLNALHDSTKAREDELMNLQATPLRGFDKLSVDRFLEKKAQVRSHWTARFESSKAADAARGFASRVEDKIPAEIAKHLVGSAAGGISSLMKKLHSSMILDPRRQKLFESILRTDPVIRDAVERNPSAAKTLIESFETMTRFAPSLTLDVNAVRSFLREAVIGGSSGVNYATIKTLIETEKALHDHGGKR